MTPAAKWSARPLTTVRQPLATLAAGSFWMLARPAGSAPVGEAVRPPYMELETTLVIRDSIAPRRQP